MTRPPRRSAASSHMGRTSRGLRTGYRGSPRIDRGGVGGFMRGNRWESGTGPSGRKIPRGRRGSMSSRSLRVRQMAARRSRYRNY